jgi:PAS domain S-box-containing protein
MTKTQLHILMVEDDPLDAELNKEQLLQLDEFECIYDWVNNREDYLKALDTTNPDLILCDYNLPQYNGAQALKDLRERDSLIPFIFVTGTMNEETAADAIKSGAWDYVVKDRLFRLPLAVRGVLNLKEEKQIASRAEEKVNRLVMAIDQSSAQIVVVSANGTIEYVNQRFTGITGYLANETIGKNVFNLPHCDSNLGFSPEAIENLKQGKIFRGEVLSRKKDGNSFWELVLITPIVNEDGIITNYVSVKEDITSRKEMELELIKARDKAEQSDHLKDAFLQNMSHEIRTPLNAIVGFSNLLHETESLTNEILKNYTSIICNSSNQLLSIVTDVLTISSIQTGHENAVLAPFNINKMYSQLYDILSPVAQNKGINFIWKNESSESFEIITDEVKLTQIITNLLNNALKFTKQGEVSFGYNIKKDLIEFFVKDTGIGIPKEKQEMIFERFFQVESNQQTSNRGTGLGLSISQSFARMLEGYITVESDSNLGSHFRVILPYKPVKSKPFSDTHPKLDLHSATILIVEDILDNYYLLEAILTKTNVNLLAASNGLEALNLCKKKPQIDLVLMDIRMPVMDGLTAFKKIREIRKDLPIIAQTAFALEQDKKNFLAAGFTDYISKPVNAKDLLNKISMAIGAKEMNE